MNYFKNKSNEVYAYDDDQLAQVSRLTELETIINEKEPIYFDALNALNQVNLALDDARTSFDIELSKEIDEGDTEALEKHNILLSELESAVLFQTMLYENANDALLKAESEYLVAKDEYEAIPIAVYDVREAIQTMKKMTPKEVESHLNPPISKEQIIAEAEQKKQSLLLEAGNIIAPLQDAVDLDIAESDEITALKEWKKYRVLLNRVDTSTAPDIAWPEKP